MFVNICLVYNSNNLLSKNFLGFLFVYFFLLNSIQMCQKAQKRPPNTINLPTCMFAKIYISRPRMLSATPAETPPKNNGDNINNNNIPQLLLLVLAMLLSASHNCCRKIQKKSIKQVLQVPFIVVVVVVVVSLLSSHTCFIATVCFAVIATKRRPARQYAQLVIHTLPCNAKQKT